MRRGFAAPYSRSNTERLIAFKTSAVAVCCCSDSLEIAGLRLHLVEQPRILDRDDGLVGESTQQLDLARRERSGLRARDHDHANNGGIAHHRDRKRGAEFGQIGVRSVPDGIPDLRIETCIGEEVGDALNFPRQNHALRGRTAARAYWASLEQMGRLRPALAGDRLAFKSLVGPQIEQAHLGSAEFVGRLDQSIEHDLKIKTRAVDDLEDVRGGRLLRDELVKPTLEIGNDLPGIVGNVGSHDDLSLYQAIFRKPLLFGPMDQGMSTNPQPGIRRKSGHHGFGLAKRCIRCLRSGESYGEPWAWETVMGSRKYPATPLAALAVGLSFAPAACIAIDTMIDAAASLVSPAIGSLSLMSPAMAQSHALTKKQSDALSAYHHAVSDFESILGQRRAQINSGQPLPNLPGQALYLARINMMSTYKDLTDAVPSKIGRPNKFGIPPAYFDAEKEPLVDEYRALFDVMETPPANAQKSATPFKDVVDLAIAIARAKGLDAANAEAAARISLGLFFAETNGNQNVGNARSNTYKGSFQTGPSEDRNGRKKWAAIKPTITAFDPALSLRDDKEEARAGDLDHRYNHWTAVRDALMGEHADLFPQVGAIVKTLPRPIDQMKLFELIQIIPSPIRSAIKSGDLVNYRISDPRIMGYLRNNSIFAFGQSDRARTSATVREILDAMWLYNIKFERALAKFNDIKAR